MRVLTTALTIVASTVAVARADVQGDYVRVGGWRYTELDRYMSCGSQARKDFEAFAARIRNLRVTRSKVYFAKGGKGLEVESREERKVDAVDAFKESNGTLKVLSATVFETDSGDTLILLGRAVFPPDDDAGCADNYLATLEPAHSSE